ncbi:hypothetical protein EJ07DRAFT_169903 [Lizonia empirigonia]|nr:hypothetical protein EJ07DRAFT_169903 [Lizonia empirigonia]
MSLLIQTKFRYRFVNKQLLHTALRSAHREKDDDDILDDGNRGLAHYGNLAIQMAMAHEAIIDRERRSVNDLHIQDHWSKTKKSRAKACKLLGIEPLITKSVRQQHQSPSDTVLDHALSAVLGAIWLDCESQEHKISDIRSTILEVLRTIDAIVDEKSVTADCLTGVDESPNHQCNLITNPPREQSETSDIILGDLVDVEGFTREWFETLPLQNAPLKLQPFAGQDDSIAYLESRHVFDINASVLASSNNHPAFEGTDVEPCADGLRYDRQGNGPSDAQREQSYLSISQNTLKNAARTVKGAKRKRSQDGEAKLDSLYHKILQAERRKLTRVSQVDQESLIQFLQHPVLEKLERKASIFARFLYLAIARSDPSVCRQPSHLPSNAATMYGEICRLEKEEALCVLMRRYYIINLCEEEQLYNDRHSHVIVETPVTVGGFRVAKPGKPIFALDSSLTERLLSKIMPDSDPGSNEFKKARSKVKRLRRLAERLRLLVKRYGFGILGLLPSGASFEQMPLTDRPAPGESKQIHRTVFVSISDGLFQ